MKNTTLLDRILSIPVLTLFWGISLPVILYAGISVAIICASRPGSLPVVRGVCSPFVDAYFGITKALLSADFDKAADIADALDDEMRSR